MTFYSVLTHTIYSRTYLFKFFEAFTESLGFNGSAGCVVFGVEKK